jgi:hypothetical protein
LADIFRTYHVSHNDYGPSGSVGFYTSDNFPVGTNVYVSAALSHVKAGSVGHLATAFIDNWTVYGAGGAITPGDPNPHNPFVSGAYINNCANITFGVFSAGGEGDGQFTVFSR